MWAGVLTWRRRSLQAFDLPRRSLSPSMPGSSWRGKGPPPFPASPFRLHGVHVCGQLDGRGLPVQTREHSFTSSQRHCAAGSPLGGTSLHCSSSPVHHGGKQCSSGLSVQAQSDPGGLRMGSEVGGFPGSPQEVAGDDRPFCHLVKSPLYTLFLTLPRSECSGHGRASSELGWSSVVHFVTLGPDSSRSQEAPFVLRCSLDSGGSALAPASVVPRSPGASGRRSSGFASLSRSTQTASFPSSSSRDPQAVSSCLATVQRFARAEGFSLRVATQVGFARRPSSRTNYQVKWSVNRQWCHTVGHSVSHPTLLKISDFLFWLRRSRKLLVSSILGYRSVLSSVFRFKLLEISSSAVLRDLLRSFKVKAPVCPPSWDLDVVLCYLSSPTFEPLSSASLHNIMKKVLFFSLVGYSQNGGGTTGGVSLCLLCFF